MTHMDLLLWRHAEAQDGQDDLARPLTEHGHRQAKRIARWLERHAPEDLRRCCSPARRARETLEAWTQDYELLPEAAPGAAPLAVLAAIGWPELERPTLIVGHQPTLGGIAALVLAGQHSTWSIRRSALWWFKRRQRHGHVETVLRAVLDPELLD